MLCSFFFFSSRRRHTRCSRDWSSDVCSSDLQYPQPTMAVLTGVTTSERPTDDGGRCSLLPDHLDADLPPPWPVELREDDRLRSEERRVGKGVDLGGRRIIKKKKRKNRV